MNKKAQEFAKKLSHEVMARYDAFLATQLTLIAREKGVSVADLCLAHDEITAVYQPKDGVVRYWIELKPKVDLCSK